MDLVWVGYREEKEDEEELEEREQKSVIIINGQYSAFQWKGHADASKVILFSAFCWKGIDFLPFQELKEYYERVVRAEEPTRCRRTRIQEGECRARNTGSVPNLRQIISAIGIFLG